MFGMSGIGSDEIEMASDLKFIKRLRKVIVQEFLRDAESRLRLLEARAGFGSAEERQESVEHLDHFLGHKLQGMIDQGDVADHHDLDYYFLFQTGEGENHVDELDGAGNEWPQ